MLTCPIPFEGITHSAEETEALGAALAARMQEDATLPPFVALFGDLGVGKTAFTRGFITSLCPGAIVRSPTFALVHEYRGPRPIFHFDMYRITGEDDLYSIGFYDYPDRGGICLTEWSENILFALPERYLSLTIEKMPLDGEDQRRITLKLIEE